MEPRGVKHFMLTSVLSLRYTSVSVFIVFEETVVR